MKLLMENWRGYLNEIGEGTLEPYPYKILPDVSHKTYTVYGFTTKKWAYRVAFKLTQDPDDDLQTEYWDISYTAAPKDRQDDEGDSDYYSLGETGEGQPLKIMSTVVKIIKDHISNEWVNQDIPTYGFEGVPKDGEGDWDETTRTKLYIRYLEKQMPPGTEFEQDGDRVKFTVPEEAMG